ncbi:MAG: hypothetical protein H6860_05870 [Rhodospirillales bacterium]|nr:hypothetical protein [Alphaproteobacteria bacterium]MCB9981907.1 hypothetical protein [Rhodospirillales bacterium]
MPTRTDEFSSIERIGKALYIHWTSSAYPEGSMEPVGWFEDEMLKMRRTGADIPPQMELAESALDKYYQAL